MDRSNGYESIAADFLAGRGSTRGVGIGVKQVRDWARSLPRGASVVDIGSGPGFPITETLVAEGLDVFAVDASPTFVETFRSRLPNTPILCEAVEDSTFFNRTFDGAIAWGLIFLLRPNEQGRFIERIAQILKPGGRFLFTAEANGFTWKDAMTQRESCSLGAEEYRRLLRASGLTEIREYQDEGGNYYFDAVSL